MASMLSRLAGEQGTTDSCSGFFYFLCFSSALSAGGFLGSCCCILVPWNVSGSGRMAFEHLRGSPAFLTAGVQSYLPLGSGLCRPFPLDLPADTAHGFAPLAPSCCGFSLLSLHSGGPLFQPIWKLVPGKVGIFSNGGGSAGPGILPGKPPPESSP